MKLDKNLNILIIGLGLLGGSYAKALKSQGFKVSAITKDKGDIEYALKENMIDYGTTEVDKTLIESADLIIFALYPKVFLDWIESYGNLIKEDTVVTDVTGVKGSIVYKVQESISAEFISAHPMAGREVCGVKNSNPEIFKGANYIVVPTDKNTEKGVEMCKALGDTLGFADVSVLGPEDHDKMIAFLSQLTHCIAVSLMCANDHPDLVRYTGDSFRDLTRIADINDEMWSELFLENKKALLDEMDSYREAFDKLYNHIKNGEREDMRQMMQLSSARRKLFGKRKTS
ncbi:MAG: prephenate dehydrogenase/arogenate dehydrogenase family protein [Clostridia bacterium]|nr:prephenate dehydrogenase/arogenate dehydrogenase family protein [Clostridia bacterium]